MKGIIFVSRWVTAAAIGLIAWASSGLPATAHEYHGVVATRLLATNTPLSERDAAFIRETGGEGRAEVRLGELGQERGQAAAVRTLAKELGKDHSQANEELAEIANPKGVDLPTYPSPARQWEISGLEGIGEGDFDRAFLNETIRNLYSGILAFEKASWELDNAELAAFAQKSATMLRHHLWMAEQVARNLGME